MYFNACQRSLTLRRRGLMQIRQVAGSPPENLPPRRFISHEPPYKTRTFIGLQSLKLECTRARVTLRQTAALYQYCVFHNTPRTSRLHYIGLQEIQSSKGHCALFSGSPICLKILLQMPSKAECQRGRRCPVQYLSQEDHLLNRLCPVEAQTALF